MTILTGGIFSDDVNPISAATWSWRAMRGHSVTFASLFASALLGISIISAFRHLLARMGLPWYVALLAPFAVIAYFARKETEWIPDPVRRRAWARRVVFSSIVLALLIAWLRSAHPETESSARNQPAVAS